MSKFNPKEPYNDLPLLPPKADIETKAVLKKALEANKALAELKGASNSIPNPEILITSITLQEAKSSSEIENIVTTNDKLYKAYSSQLTTFDSQTKEVLRYKDALWKGFNELKEKNLLTTNLFVKLYQIIKENDGGIRKTPGTKLTKENGDIVYTPPEGEELIRSLLKNLEDYIHNDQDNIDPLIKSAVIHYQFESIHPFFDGNGRTGRILLILYFVQNQLLDLPILYLSRYIIQNKNDYYISLRKVTENNDWENWILYLLEGIRATAIETTELVKSIYNLMQETAEIVKENRQNPVPKEVVELIHEQPYCKTEFIIQKGIAKRKAAERYLKELERLQILKSEKVGKEVVYLNQKLLKILSKG